MEILLYTGQRFQSVTLPEASAVALGEDMRGRVMVDAVTVIDVATGECDTQPSHAAVATRDRPRRGDGA